MELLIAIAPAEATAGHLPAAKLFVWWGNRASRMAYLSRTAERRCEGLAGVSSSDSDSETATLQIDRTPHRPTTHTPPRIGLSRLPLAAEQHRPPGIFKRVDCLSGELSERAHSSQSHRALDA